MFFVKVRYIQTVNTVGAEKDILSHFGK